MGGEYHYVRRQFPAGIRVQRRPLMLEATLAAAVGAAAPWGGAISNCTEKRARLMSRHPEVPAELNDWPGFLAFQCGEMQLSWCNRFSPEHSNSIFNLCPETCGKCAHHPILPGESPYALAGAE